MPFEDIHQKSSPAVANPFLQTDRTSHIKEEALATDSSWEDDDQTDIVNYTLASDMAVFEAGPPEAVTASSREGMMDAAADVSKFPSKNDL